MSGANGTVHRTNFFATEETVEMDLGDGFWVELKRGLDYGEESELEGAAIRAGLNPDGTPKLEYSLKQQRNLMLALYIVDWNLTGANDKPVVLPDDLGRRQQAVSRLSPRTARRIVARIDQLRIEDQAIDTISLREAEGAEADPTTPGDASETVTSSPSANGSAALTPGPSSGRPTASSGKRSR